MTEKISSVSSFPFFLEHVLQNYGVNYEATIFSLQTNKILLNFSLIKELRLNIITVFQSHRYFLFDRLRYSLINY